MVSIMALWLLSAVPVQATPEAWRVYLEGLRERSELSVSLKSGETVSGLLSDVGADAFAMWVESEYVGKNQHLRREIRYVEIAAVVPRGSTPVAGSFSDLPGRIRIGDDVRVNFRDRKSVTGKLSDIDWDREMLVIGSGSEALELSGADIATLDLKTRDSLWNGFAIGFAIGAGLTALPCSNFCNGTEFLIAGSFYGLVGGGLGALFDSMVSSRETVYVAGDEQRETSFAIVPIVSRDRAGLAFSLSF